MSEVRRPAPLVVVGAGAAGITVVDALRRQGYDAPIVLVGAEPHPPYDRPPLSKAFLLGSLERSRLFLRQPAALERLDVEILLGRQARELDTGARRVVLDDGTELPYSRLVVATGVRAARPGGVGAAQDVHVLRTMDDAERLAAAIPTASSALIIGGGPLGYELAASARSAGLSVTLVDSAQVPLTRMLGPLAGAVIGGLHREHGVELRPGRWVRTVDRAGPAGPAVITLDDGSTISADLVIAAVGSHPNVEWLSGSGLELSDGVGCDQVGQAAPGVYAVGDVARWCDAAGRGVRMEHRTNATTQALAVAEHITSGTRAAPVIPYVWTDQFGERIQIAGQIPAHAQTQVVAGDLSTRRFVMTATEGGTLHGVLAWRMAKDFARRRAELAHAY